MLQRTYKERITELKTAKTAMKLIYKLTQIHYKDIQRL